MNITICGSMTHESQMVAIAQQLTALGHTIYLPDMTEARSDSVTKPDVTLKNAYIKNHFAKINQSEAVLIVNEEKNGVANYIGGNTLIEMSHAANQGLEVFLLHPIPEVAYKDEIEGMFPIVLDGKLDAIDSYIDTLPLVVMSTLSPVKHLAVKRAMRRFGVPVRTQGNDSKSGVSEQPMSVAETYEGAMNRHKSLAKSTGSADYYCTIESGFENIHESHNPFGCAVLIFQKAGENLEVGIDIDIEFPKDVFDEVPSKYADVGVLIQEKYKSPYKDAYPFLTQGRLSRVTLLENALFSVLVKTKELAS